MPNRRREIIVEVVLAGKVRENPDKDIIEANGTGQHLARIWTAPNQSKLSELCWLLSRLGIMY